MLNPVCEMLTFSSLSPSGRGRRQQQAGLESNMRVLRLKCLQKHPAPPVALTTSSKQLI